MRLKGKKIESRNVEYIVIPRTNREGQSEDIVLKAQAILSFEDFDKMCPMPEPKTAVMPGGETKLLTEEPAYKESMDKYGRRKMQYLTIKSLEATEGLEWETVKINDPTTWDNIETELQASGFSAIEVGRIQQGIAKANALSDEKLEEARERFLASLRQPANA